MIRRRNLIILGAAALISVVLAVIAADSARRRKPSRISPPAEFLPGFAAHVKNAARIHVVVP